MPFPVHMTVETLGVEGSLGEICVSIYPVGEMPLDTVTNLVALISPNNNHPVQVWALPGGQRVMIGQCFDAFVNDDGTYGGSDDSARSRWVLGVLREVLPPLHDLHPIKSVTFSPGR